MSCFSLSLTCHGSHRDGKAALKYMDFLDKNEPLDNAGLISDDDGSANFLPRDGGLEIRGREGESEARSSDQKSMTTRVTMAMIRCAFVEVHVEEEMLAEFGDLEAIENMGDESVEHGPLGEGLVAAEVEHKVEEEALVADTLLTGAQINVGSNDGQPLT